MSTNNKEEIPNESLFSYEESIARLLIEYNELPDTDAVRNLVSIAQSGFAKGANDFFEQSIGTIDNKELKANLRIYPLVQALLGVLKFHDLNHNTTIIRTVLNTLLDVLETRDQGSTLH